MRIAYIAPYQGPALLKRRPILRNLGLAANVKMELIAELLRRSGHEVEILSQGEVVDRQWKFFPALREADSSRSATPVFYASALPIKFVNGAWSSRRTLDLFRQRHRASPFGLVLIYNLKHPQVVCADYAKRKLGLPVIVEYEDDAIVDLAGKAERGLRSRYYVAAARRILRSAAGGMGVSPHLLSRLPSSIPKFLLRGVVDEDIILASRRPLAARKNWVAFSGTHYRSKGLEPLITAWSHANLPGWELHIAGRGELTTALEKLAQTSRTIVFHGLLNREENARFLSEAKIGINPHDLSLTPGNVFAFKIIEYLAAGAHCITTPMGALEPDLEAGITYMPDNSPQTIAATLERVIQNRDYERLAAEAATRAYGPDAVAAALANLVGEVTSTKPGLARSPSPAQADRWSESSGERAPSREADDALKS